MKLSGTFEIQMDHQIQKMKCCVNKQEKSRNQVNFPFPADHGVKI